MSAFPGHEFRLLVVVPNKRKGPAPCFVGPNFSGNHSLVDDAKVAIPTAWMRANPPVVKDNKATEEGRGKNKDVWNFEQSIDRGYAVATFYYGEIDPDRTDAARRDSAAPAEVARHRDASLAGPGRFTEPSTT